MTVATQLHPEKIPFLVDSQADISVIKRSSVPSAFEINHDEIISIKGITDNFITSVGTIEINLLFDEFYLIHTIHVVPDEFAIPVPGILGKDFLKDFQCTIDYATMTLTIVVDSGSVTLNIWEGPEENTIVIPPRCEVIRHFKTNRKTNLNQDQYIDSTEVTPGVIIAKSIFNPNSAFLRVINTTNETKVMKNKLPKSEDLSLFNIYAVDEIKFDTNRAEKVSEIVGKDVPKYLRNDLQSLCKRYADLFAL